MKLAVVGSRDGFEYNRVALTLSQLGKELDITAIVSGGARGIDSFAETWAKQNNIPTIIFNPDWDKYGKKAGYLRNQTIVEECDKLVAFWDRQSRGTMHSINIAKTHNKLYRIYGCD